MIGGNSRRIIVVVAIGVLCVWSIIGWRYLRPEQPPPQQAAAPTIVERVQVVADHPEVVALQASHQELVDQLQSTQDRFASQQAEIKKLSDELRLVTGELSSLRGALAKAAVEERPKRKRKRRR